MTLEEEQQRVGRQVGMTPHNDDSPTKIWRPKKIKRFFLGGFSRGVAKMGIEP